MLGRIVEVSTDSRFLSLDRGFLVVSAREGEVGRTPIDDVAGLIGNAHGLSYTNNLLVAMAERAIPLVLCGANHSPVGLLWPVAGHHRQGARMDAQIESTLPQRKRLWRQIVRAKLSMQSAALDLCDLDSGRIRRLIATVRAGDASNVEGQAAALYWPRFFGAGFRRDRSMEGVNALLNYGYTVLRATVARHVMASGLHPGIPLHHAHEGNPMRLVDDLMEPFRPLVDLWVKRLAMEGDPRVDSNSKRALALLPARNLRSERGVGPVTLAVQRLSTSLAQALEGEGERLAFPECTAESLAHVFEDPAASEGAEAVGPPDSD